MYVPAPLRPGAPHREVDKELAHYARHDDVIAHVGIKVWKTLKDVFEFFGNLVAFSLLQQHPFDSFLLIFYYQPLD